MNSMRPNDIQDHVRRQPFQPFRIFVSDGAHHDVRHPEMVLLGRSELIIGLQRGGVDVFENFAHCNPVHVTRIDPLNGA